MGHSWYETVRVEAVEGTEHPSQRPRRQTSARNRSTYIQLVLVSFTNSMAPKLPNHVQLRYPREVATSSLEDVRHLSGHFARKGTHLLVLAETGITTTENMWASSPTHRSPSEVSSTRWLAIEEAIWNAQTPDRPHRHHIWRVKYVQMSISSNISLDGKLGR